MRIAHVGLASYYTDGMTYQDNHLAEQNVRDGHETLYISNAEKYVDGKLVETGYEDITLECGVHLIRLPYVHTINKFISGKFRKVQGLSEILDKFKPDVILSHDLGYYSVLEVIRYKKDHVDVKLYADTHTDEKNSGRNWLSLHILHRLFYRYLVQRALKYLEKYFYICPDSRRFSVENYGVPEGMMEFLPLGAKILPEEEYREKRKRKRDELALRDGELLLVHSGKLDKLKKTDILLKAFGKVTDLHAKLVIIGSMADDVQESINKLVNLDERVEYLGWKSGDELLEYLCACDLYCQPGSGSATLQNAVGCFCPAMCYPLEGYLMLDKGNFIWVKSEEDMVNVFQKIEAGNIKLSDMVVCAQRCALELLDYRKLATALYR